MSCHSMVILFILYLVCCIALKQIQYKIKKTGIEIIIINIWYEIYFPIKLLGSKYELNHPLQKLDWFYYWWIQNLNYKRTIILTKLSLIFTHG